MQSLTFDKVISFGKIVNAKLASTGVEVPDPGIGEVPWTDALYIGDNYRRAHVHMVDAREKLSLWVLHCTVFPQINDTSPIFGLDIIAGPTKISGAFLDFSKTATTEHDMMKWFSSRVSDLTWKKPRQLPDWGLQIFSDDMVAVGALNSEAEIDQLIEVCYDTLSYYLDNVGNVKKLGDDWTVEQNRYCHYQKLNPHSTRIMKMLGLGEEAAKRYFEEVMFQEINT